MMPFSTISRPFDECRAAGAADVSRRIRRFTTMRCAIEGALIFKQARPATPDKPSDSLYIMSRQRCVSGRRHFFFAAAAAREYRRCRCACSLEMPTFYHDIFRCANTLRSLRPIITAALCQGHTTGAHIDTAFCFLRGQERF